MKPRTYDTPLAFKAALEQRLRNAASDGLDFARRRQLLVFDRFLARVVTVFGEAAVLKGGLVLELRLARARTTKDIDLRMTGSSSDLLPELQRGGRLDLGDFMTFELTPDPDLPVIQNDGMQYDGFRFRAQCRIAGRVYGDPFGVDIAFGDPIVGEPDVIVADDVLSFAGILPPTLRVYPVETHLAEKLHAYTLPRSRPNSRVKDLPDIALIATIGPLDGKRVRSALEQTFEARDTHPLPPSLPAPNEAWTQPYAAMAIDNELPWRTLPEVTAAARGFLDPVLGGAVDATWAPALWRWE
jgi:hypothetical protein